MLLVLPKEVTIKDKHNRPINGIVGPLNEGTDLKLVCEAFGKYKCIKLIYSWFD
jgi:hypothetical protein